MKCYVDIDKKILSEDSLIFDYDSVLRSTSNDRNDVIIVEVDNADVDGVRGRK